MPYLISDKQSDCQGWATVKEESDGSYTTIGCHTSKQDAIDQMVAISIAEGLEPGGEVANRALPDNYRPALADDVPEGRACGNCYFYNEEKKNDAGTKAWCEKWLDYVDGGYYCNAWQAEEANRQVDLSVPSFISANAKRGLKYYSEGFGGDGLVPATIAAAREMAAGKITESKVRKMAPWFARHKVDGRAPSNRNPSDPGYPGAGLVAWLLWGGDSNFSDRAQNWAQRKIDALNAEAESRRKMKKIERRTYTVKDVQARSAEDGTMRLAGYAAVFNESSVPLPFKESIAPGAFRKTLTETPDVRLLINHEGLPLARSKNGTLKLNEDDRGLYFEAELADTTEARDIYKLVERGDVDQMSFGFRVIRQKWSDDRSRRILTEVSLADGDVSVVTYPAYPTTTVEAREKLAKAIEAAKAGRDITPEDMAILQTVFSDLEEGHEYIMRAVQIMSGLMGSDTSSYGYEDEDEDEDMKRATDVVGDFVEWDSSGGTARGRIVKVLREGVLNIPDSTFTITAEDDDPAVLIRVYRELRDGYVATETLVGHKRSELRSIPPLKEPSEDASRKISLRLAQAIVNNTK
ncbi:MAG: HK97 family phage prohead protease [Cyanobacteria bacterium REEB494]|nr:HK97 family phage prohead protease [Cyanobacteria bacterium REEB494]